jgi:cytochrome c biogenesis protein CcmG/thiol:disulfide interchange protein DsbE
LTTEEFADAKKRTLQGAALTRPTQSPQATLRAVKSDVPTAVRETEERQGCLKTASIVILILIGITFLIGLAVPASKTDQNNSQLQTSRINPVNKPLPEFTLAPAISGLPNVTKADFVGGRPRLLNIWASWCVPCIAEAQQLNALKAEGVEIVGIAIRDRPEDVTVFLSRHGNPYTRIGSDLTSEVPLAIGSSGVPETFVVDAEGVIRYQHFGAIRPDDVSRILVELDMAR